MTYSNGLKSVVSDCGKTVAPHKTLNLNPSAKEPKNLMWVSLTVQPEKTTTSLSGGGRYYYKRISAFQSSKIQSGCEDSNSSQWKALQIQYKLPYYLDTQIPQENPCGESC